MFSFLSVIYFSLRTKGWSSDQLAAQLLQWNSLRQTTEWKTLKITVPLEKSLNFVIFNKIKPWNERADLRFSAPCLAVGAMQHHRNCRNRLGSEILLRVLWKDRFFFNWNSSRLLISIHGNCLKIIKNIWKFAVEILEFCQLRTVDPRISVWDQCETRCNVTWCMLCNGPFTPSESENIFDIGCKSVQMLCFLPFISDVTFPFTRYKRQVRLGAPELTFTVHAAVRLGRSSSDRNHKSIIEGFIQFLLSRWLISVQLELDESNRQGRSPVQNFPQRAPTFKGVGKPIYYSAKISWKLHENEESWAKVWGNGGDGTCKILLCGSATVRWWKLFAVSCCQ